VIREAEVERHEVGVDDEEVGEVLVYRPHDLVVVGFGKSLKRRLLDDVAEVYPSSAATVHRCILSTPTDVVFAVLGLAQLLDQALYGFGGRSYEAETAQMAHLLPLLIVQSAMRGQSYIAANEGWHGAHSVR
jgi:hypothetical protein